LNLVLGTLCVHFENPHVGLRSTFVYKGLLGWTWFPRKASL
jgi:hypothetical protein